ncbi:hypothetical protein BDD12DRAFT_933621 [Trichophaea hybrida]|nr:hypothetical protein BDD12DRAFT_933621 [Trichophaea hybrida]
MAPGVGNKRARQLRAARTIKKQRIDDRNTGVELPNELVARIDKETEEELWSPGQVVVPAEVHWDNNFEDEAEQEEDECELTDIEEEEAEDDEVSPMDTDAFEALLDGSKKTGVFDEVYFRYQRGVEPSERTVYRQKKNQLELRLGAQHTRTIESYFKNPSTIGRPDAYFSSDELHMQDRQLAIKALEKKLQSKKTILNSQTLMRHQAVLAFLRIQDGKQIGETREQMAGIVTRCFGKGIYFARQVVSWEIEWMFARSVPEEKRGCFSKTRSWFNDEGVQNAVRIWLQDQREEDITAYTLAKTIGEYLDSKRAIPVLENIFQFGAGGNRVRARTARRWLKKMGLVHGRYTKGVYVDGHERTDVVEYRTKVFIPLWKRYQDRFVIFKEDGSWKIPHDLPEGEKPIVLITHDESTFNANDGKQKGWMRKGHQLLQQKNKGRGIMVSGFLTLGGRLAVPNSIPNSELLNNLMWIQVNGIPVRDSMWLHEYSKDNYWTGEKMVWHTLRIALPIFRYAFPGCQALFAFGNASNHCTYADNALVVSHMNLNPGGKQSLLREGFDHSRGLPQAMIRLSPTASRWMLCPYSNVSST